MMQAKYVNIGFICRQCHHFLSIPELFPSRRYPAASEFKVQCMRCSTENTFTTGDLELKVGRCRQAAAGK